MRSYPHHISDFNSATRHLTRLERGIYRDLIELYYETESQLPLDVAIVARKIVANECSTDVERVLNEFFTKTPNGWYHDRCEDEIEKFRANNSQKALAGKASAAKKAEKKQQALSGNSTNVERPLNSVEASLERNATGNQNLNLKPLTNKDVLSEHLPRRRDKPLPFSERPDDVSESVWEEWKAHRKRHKAAITPSVIADFRKESVIAGMTLPEAMAKSIARGWRGFEAKWLANERSPPTRSTKFDPLEFVNRGKNERAGTADPKVIEAERIPIDVD